MTKKDYANHLNDIVDIIIEYKIKYLDDNVMLDKIKHIRNCGKLSRKLEPTNDLLYMGMLYHDIGRFIQYDKIHCFDDKIQSHLYLGKEWYEQQKELNNIFIQNAILYHEDLNSIPKTLDIKQKQFIYKVRAIDMLENSYFGVKDYLEREIQTDAKHYKQNNPTLDMTIIRKDYLSKFLKSENLKKDCITYAEYILFAFNLLVQGLNIYPQFKKQINLDIYDWYEKIIRKYINEQQQKQILKYVKEVKHDKIFNKSKYWG